jgi:hypothetical protein
MRLTQLTRPLPGGFVQRHAWIGLTGTAAIFGAH